MSRLLAGFDLEIKQIGEFNEQEYRKQMEAEYNLKLQSLESKPFPNNFSRNGKQIRIGKIRTHAKNERLRK